ncbi:MAG: glutamate--tRNA ligase [Gammaproteobacteria bacterium]
MTVRTRFAPSPTGYLHIGGARTALFSWLYARHCGGEFVLRVEDTDRERSTEESVNAILEGMEWLGLDYDEGPIFQTQRFDRYREVVQQLLDAGKAYRCYCTREELAALRAEQLAKKLKPRYDGRHRGYDGPPRDGVDAVIRFKNPLDGAVMVDDLVRGSVTYRNAELDDLIIARSDGSPTYNFTVVIDDMDMGITHVIRGDDHLNNTPRQINIFEALGAPSPCYAHVPMILGADGKRLSKRHGAVSVLQYRDEGYLPHALLNYLVRLGWSHGDQEVFSREELVHKFQIEDINRSASVFNPEKLQWLNQHYLRETPSADIAARLPSYLSRLNIAPDSGPDLADLAEVQKERVKTLAEMAEVSRFFFQEFDEYDEKAAKKNLKAAALEPLRSLRDRLQSLDTWDPEHIHEVVQGVATRLDLKIGRVAQPLRVAVTGTAVSPSIDKTLWLLGRNGTITRVKRAIDHIERKSA